MTVDPREGELVPGAQASDSKSYRYVAVVCITYNSTSHIHDLVSCIPDRVNTARVELHVVDSGSKDDTVRRIQQMSSGAIFIHEMHANRGFAAGINVAVESLRRRSEPPAAIIIINPDVRFDSATIEALLDTLDNFPGVGIAVPTLVDQYGSLQFSLRHRPHWVTTWSEAILGGPLASRAGLPTETIRRREHYEAGSNVGWATGGFLAVSWPCMTAVGYWDESYFLYEEEVDFCLKSSDLGFAVRHVPDAQAERILADGRAAPWIMAMMRVKRVTHVRRRSGTSAAAVVWAGLAMGDLIRACVGRREARAGLWALTRCATAKEILERYRPDAEASLTARYPVDLRGVRSDLARIAAAFAAGSPPQELNLGNAHMDEARKHEVLLLVSSQHGTHPSIESDVRRAAIRSLQQAEGVDMVRRALHQAGIEWLLLKGFILSDSAYRVAGVRESNDIDVLVRPNQFECAIKHLEDTGAVLLDRNWPIINQQFRGELCMILPNGALLDLHWHVLNNPLMRRRLSIDTDMLFADARPVQLDIGSVMTLSATDTVIYAAVHAWKSGGARLKWFLDIQQTYARVASYANIERRAKELRVDAIVEMMLDRSVRALGDPGLFPGFARHRVGSRVRIDRRTASVDRLLTSGADSWLNRQVLASTMVNRSLSAGGILRASSSVIKRRLRPTPPVTLADLHSDEGSELDREQYFAAVQRAGVTDPAARSHVLIIVENLSVPFDRRVWQEATALVDAGYSVSIICPKGEKQDTEAHVVIDGVSIHRYRLRTSAGGISGYLREYGLALIHSARLAFAIHRARPVDIIHACNPPDLLLLVGLPFKLVCQSTLVFDHHDLVPELFESRFGSRSSILYWVARVLERATFAIADGVISTNESYRATALTRGHVEPHRVTVVRSAPNLAHFTAERPDPALRRRKDYLLAYLGVMGPQDGVDYALRAIAHLRDTLGRSDFNVVMMGGGDSLREMTALRDELRLNDCVEFVGRVSDHYVRTCLSTADVCLAPDPMNPLNNVSTMNKIVEYMAMGCAIVSFDLNESRVSAGEAATYAEANNVAEFAELISSLLDDENRRSAMGRLGRDRVASDLSWANSERELLAFYNSISDNRRRLAGPHRG